MKLYGDGRMFFFCHLIVPTQMNQTHVISMEPLKINKCATTKNNSNVNSPEYRPL